MGMFDKVRGSKPTKGAEDDSTLGEALNEPGPQAGGPEAREDAVPAYAPSVPGETSVADPLADQGLDDPPDLGEAVDDEQRPDDDVSEDLMEIFSSEEEENVDLAALTQSLEEIDVPSLLSLATDVSTELADFVDTKS